MCSRYSNSKSENAIKIGEHEFRFTNGPQFVIRPTNMGQILLLSGGKYVEETYRWGFKTSWSPQPVFNARGETVAQKPTFKAAYRARRCLVLACGFYESEDVGGRKLPMRVIMRKQTTMTFAGLWNPGDADAPGYYTIVTTSPNEVVGRFHDRMPVILTPTGCADWLHDDWGKLDKLLVPYPAGEMEAYRVTPQVFKSGFQSPEALKPLA